MIKDKRKIDLSLITNVILNRLGDTANFSLKAFAILFLLQLASKVAQHFGVNAPNIFPW